MPWYDIRLFRAQLNLNDWTTTIQEAIDTIVGQRFEMMTPKSIPETLFGTLYFPPGIYPITRPLLIRVQNTNQAGVVYHEFCTIDLVGDTPGSTLRATGENHGAILRAEFLDGPAIIIQGGAGVRIRNLVIEGKNDWIQVSGQDPLDMRTHLDDDANKPYLVPTNPAPRDNPHSPHAGICIDPFSVNLPTSDRYPGLDQSYQRAPVAPNSQSTNTVIEGCTIRGFVVGVLIGANDRASNDENIHLIDTAIESTAVAIAVGHGQARNVTLSDVTVFGARCAVDCISYGVTQGCSVSIFGGRMVGVRELFQLNSAPGGSAAIHNLRADHILGLGQFCGNEGALAFDGCSFLLGSVPDDRATVDAHLINSTTAVFSGCTFAVVPPRAQGDRQDFPWKIYNEGTVTFNACLFATTQEKVNASLWVTERPHQVAYNACVLAQRFLREPFGQLHSGVPRWSPPGACYHDPTADEPRVVVGALPRIFLRSGLLEEDGPGRARFTVIFNQGDPPADVAFAGDLLVLFGLGGLTIGALGNFSVEPSSLVVGVLKQVDRAADRWVYRIELAGRWLSKWMSRNTSELAVVYFPAIHPSTRGDVTQGMTTVSKVAPSVAWNVGDRIAGPGLVPGTVVTKVAPGQLELSEKPVLDTTSARLYDADCRALTVVIP